MTTADGKCNFGKKTDFVHVASGLRVATQQRCQEQQAQMNDADDGAVNMLGVFLL